MLLNADVVVGIFVVLVAVVAVVVSVGHCSDVRSPTQRTS